MNDVSARKAQGYGTGLPGDPRSDKYINDCSGPVIMWVGCFVSKLYATDVL